MVFARVILATQAPDVAAFIALLVVVALVAAAVQYIRVPYSVALVVTGLALALAPDVPQFQLTPGIILTVFLPVLLFHGAYNVDFEDLRASVVPIALLALPGVAATAAFVAVALQFTTALNWPEALLFGAIVAATDPVATIAVYSDVGAPRRLSTLVMGESLFNDGTALVFFTTMVGIATASTINAGVTFERLIVAVVGSLALGAVVAVAGSTVLRQIDDALIETTITLIMAYGGYLLAVRLGTSGPLETVASGLLFGAMGQRVMAPTTRLQARATWEFLDFLANSLLFLLVGLEIKSVGSIVTNRLGQGVWWPLLVAIVAVLVARVLVVGAVGQIMRHRGNPFPPGWTPVVIWAGLRGAVSLAAALSMPSSLLHRDLLLTLTFGVVLFTLLVQGLTTGRLLERVGLGNESVDRHDMELLMGRLSASRAALLELDLAAERAEVSEPAVQRLRDEYTRESAKLQGQLHALQDDGELWNAQRNRQVRRQVLRAEERAARDAYNQGLISLVTLRTILADIDRTMAHLESQHVDDL